MAERLGSALPTQLPGFDSPYPLHLSVFAVEPDWYRHGTVNSDVTGSNPVTAAKCYNPLMKNGPYELVAAPTEYPGFKYRGKYCYEHHLVWWRTTGEIIENPYCIHHKNEDKRDNSFSNLEKLTKSDHTSLHGFERAELFARTRLPKHGTDNEYSRHGCRCDDCRVAHNLLLKNWRAKTGKTTSWYNQQKKIGSVV